MAHRDLLTFPWLVLFQVRQLARTSFFLQTALAAPAAFVLLRVTAGFINGPDSAHSLWFDGAIAGIWATTTTATGMLGYQRFLGTFEYLIVSPLRPSVVYGSILAASAFLGLIGVPLAVALQFVTDHVVSVTSQQILGLLAALFACVASAHVLAAVFVFSRHANAFEPLLLVPVWLLVGVVVPTDGLPRPLALVALLHPISSAVRASRETAMSSAVSWACVSVVIGVMWLYFGSRLLVKAQQLAALHGTSGKS